MCSIPPPTVNAPGVISHGTCASRARAPRSAGTAPENTADSVVTAMSMGADGIGLDVHPSCDGTLVVIHDETLDRTTDGAGPVGVHALLELKRLDAAARFPGCYRHQRIPTLEEAVDAAGPMAGIDIGMKSDIVRYQGIERALAESIAYRAVADRVIVSSFNPYSLVEFKRFAPAVDVGLLYTAAPVDIWHYAQRVGAQALHPLHFSAVREMVSAARSHGIRVNTWTPDTESHIHRVVAAEVDSIITNRPDVALRAMGMSAR